jgi:hypothetical protein
MLPILPLKFHAYNEQKVLKSESDKPVVLNLLGSKSRLKTSFGFETIIPVKEICQLFVAVMFQCIQCSLQNTKEILTLVRKQGIKMKFISNLG